MLKMTQKSSKSVSLTAIVATAAVLSLFAPAAQASTVVSADTSPESFQIEIEDLAAISESQIKQANSGIDKFNVAQLFTMASKDLQETREAREQRIAEEKAEAKRKAEEKKKKEAEAKAKREAEEKARKEAEAKELKEKQEAEKLEAEQLQKQSTSRNKSLNGSSSPASSSKLKFSGGGSKTDWLKAAGIAESDWQYVDFIVKRESGWNPNAVNSSSGASGLVQALPCGKVPGSCFDPVDNLTWADSYAKNRYGSWKNAYSFWTSNHWW